MRLCVCLQLFDKDRVPKTGPADGLRTNVIQLE